MQANCADLNWAILCGIVLCIGLLIFILWHQLRHQKLKNSLLLLTRNTSLLPHHAQQLAAIAWNVHSVQQIGEFLRTQGHPLEALHLHHALLQTKKHPSAHLCLGNDYLSIGILDKAQHHFQTALDLLPDTKEAELCVQKLIFIAQRTRDWAEAARLLRCYPRLATVPSAHIPALFQVLCELAMTCQAQSPAQSKYCLQEAFRLSPSAARPRLELGKITPSLQQALQLWQPLLSAEDTVQHLLAEVLKIRCQLPQNRAEIITYLLSHPQCLRHTSLLHLLCTILPHTPWPQRASILEYLLHNNDSANQAQHTVQTLVQTVQIQYRAICFQCQSCQLTLRTHHWRCPACHRWNSIQIDTCLALHQFS